MEKQDPTTSIFFFFKTTLLCNVVKIILRLLNKQVTYNWQSRTVFYYYEIVNTMLEKAILH